jgi:polygalacturonase
MKRQVVAVCVVAITLILIGSVAQAATPTIATGDTRTVNQPTYPAVCQTLSAAGTSSSGTDQTSQITTALTSCAGKGSVVLQSSGSNNTFWAKGFAMASNEALVINSGVTLRGNAYTTQFINPVGSNISIMGPGTIDGGSVSKMRLINTGSITNFVVYNVTLTNAGKMNLYVQGGNGFTAWGVTIREAATTKNTDGVDIDSMTNATVANSDIEDGDDCIAVKTNAAAVSNVTVKGTKCHGTHGLSIGSQTFDGVSNILFENNYIYGKDLSGTVSSDNQGIRIKTDPTCGGHVDKVEYLNTCETYVRDQIWLDTNYGSCSGTAGTPWFTNIVINGVYSASSPSGPSSEIQGYNASNIMTVWLENISLDGTEVKNSQYANVGLYNSNITPTGTGITTYAYAGSGSIPACSF